MKILAHHSGDKFESRSDLKKDSKPVGLPQQRGVGKHLRFDQTTVIIDVSCVLIFCDFLFLAYSKVLDYTCDISLVIIPHLRKNNQVQEPLLLLTLN